MQPKTDFHWQAHDETIVINRSQDVEPILNHAAELRREGITGAGTDMHHVASFPFVLVEAYLSRAGISMNEFMTNPEHPRRMLQDPALSGFRIHTGRVS